MSGAWQQMAAPRRSSRRCWQHRHRDHQVRGVLPHRASARCWPRRSTRWPTPATRCCCSLGGKRAEQDGDRRAPVRLRPRALHLLASSSPSCCSASVACSRSTRPTTSTTRSTRATHDDPSTTGWWWVPLRGARRRHRAGEPLLPHRDQGDRQDPRRARRCRQFIRRAKQPELPGHPARGLRRPARPGVRAARRRALAWSPGNHYFDVAGTTLIGAPAGRRRGRPGHRDQEPAAGRVGQPREAQRRIERAARRPPTGSSGVIHMKTLHLGPEELLVAAKIAGRAGRHAPTQVAAGDRRRRAGDPRRRADRPGDLPRARHLPRRLRTGRAPGASGAAPGTDRGARARPPASSRIRPTPDDSPDVT